MNNFAGQLNYLRTEKSMSRKSLANELNVSVRLVSYWENGKRECSFDTLIKIADIFSVSTDFLLGRTDY
ncbi:MAG: helix-turn-helix transcriptional regulator [Candidatus Borkfalkiaceae bacterium]|nr:helix-turn-helix transcriptional regulator [Christensenellaceae bacterium]